MKRSVQFLIGCFALIVCGGSASAEGYLESTITAYRIDQKTYSSKGNTEAYLLESELLRRIEGLYEYQFESIEGLPINRLISEFINSNAAIAIGFCVQNESLEYVLQAGHLGYPLISAPLYRYRGFRIYTRKTDPVINSLEELIAKNVGIVRGMALPAKLRDLNSKLKDKIYFETVGTEKQSLSMLKLGRIDAFISNAAEAALMEGGERYSAHDFKSSPELGRISCGVFLGQSNDGARLLSAINVVISDMYLDGSYCEIMKNSKVSAIPCEQ